MDQMSGIKCPRKQTNKQTKNYIGFEIQAPIRPQVDIKAIASICWHSTGLHEGPPSTNLYIMYINAWINKRWLLPPLSPALLLLCGVHRCTSHLPISIFALIDLIFCVFQESSFFLQMKIRQAHTLPSFKGHTVPNNLSSHSRHAVLIMFQVSEGKWLRGFSWEDSHIRLRHCSHTHSSLFQYFWRACKARNVDAWLK